MADTKFSLIIQGDTSSTSRLYDSISRGAVPVIVSDHLTESGLPFTWRVPWKDFVVYMPTRLNKAEMASFFNQISELGRNFVEQRQKVMLTYAPDVQKIMIQGEMIKSIVSNCVLFYFATFRYFRILAPSGVSSFRKYSDGDSHEMPELGCQPSTF